MITLFNLFLNVIHTHALVYIEEPEDAMFVHASFPSEISLKATARR